MTPSASSSPSPATKAARLRVVKADEVVLLYEKLLANLSELLAACTQHLQQPTAAAAADSPAAALAAALRLQLAVAEAQRTACIAESHARAGLLPAALALLALLLERTRKARELPSPPATADLQVLDEQRSAVQQLEQVERHARAQQLLLHARQVLQQLSASSQAATALAGLSLRDGQSSQQPQANSAASPPPSASASASSFNSAVGPLLSRVDVFSVGPASALLHLADWPPAYAAAPCKPVLFDLAFNAVQHPSTLTHTTRAAAQTEEEVKGQSSGQRQARIEEAEEDDREQQPQPQPLTEPSRAGGLLGAVGGAVGGLGKWVGWGR